jgi:GT2 family glycosyltransferase
LEHHLVATPIETLVLPQGRPLSWNEFDAAWYGLICCAGEEIPDPLQDYLAVGQGLGRSPNVFFDEVWYLGRNKDVAESVISGHFSSGFDHYCRVGFRSRSPHWLFDVGFYESTSPDLSAENLATAGFLNTYDHFLRVGSREGRAGHPLFDSNTYRDQQDDPTPPYVTYLYRLRDRQQNPPTSIYFDATWYEAVYARALNDSSSFLSPLHHYLCNDTPGVFDPLPHFSEQYYLSRYADVAKAVSDRIFATGYIHFLRAGVFELRSPAPHIDLEYYWEHHESVRRAVQTGRIRDAFAHLITVGAKHGLMLVPYQPAPDIPEPQTRALFAAQAQTLLPLYGRNPIDFTLSGPPICSVVIAINNGFPLTMQTIASLRQNHPGDIELILIDSGSVDEVRMIERYVTGVQVFRLNQNVGFPRACNAGLQCATGPFVLFLNSDIRLDPGAIAAAIARLESDPQIGAVGGKVVRSNELLQEAGCIIWRDGWTTGYLRDQSPLCPEACFVRDVDFCSAVFMMARTGLLRQLDGFDDAFSPAYFEDADLGIRIWEAGYRFVYDPAIVLHHYEYGSSPDPRGAQAMMRARHRLFFEKHLLTLRFRHVASPAAAIFARAVDRHHRRVLFIEDTIPLPALGSGYVRANDIIRVMAAMDYRVTVFPVQPSAAHISTIHADFPDTVEVMHNRSLKDLSAFLQERRGYYDCIWICRTHNLDQVRPMLEEANLTPDRTRIILDTEAVAATRTALRATFLGSARAENEQDALRREFRSAFFCQYILTVNQKEARLLAELGIPDVRVLGTMRDVTLTPRPWEKRAGMLFVGSLYSADSPNFDSLCWFVDDVLPLIEAELGYETRLTIAGYVAPELSLARFADHARITLAGPVATLAPLYDRHRVVVAPTRFAAGTPYKVYEAASFGVPVVATTLLAEQLGWRDGEELLCAAASDPSGFAEKTVALYRSSGLWNKLRVSAADRLRQENGWDAYAAVLKAVLPYHGEPSVRVG